MIIISDEKFDAYETERMLIADYYGYILGGYNNTRILNY